MIDTGSIVRHKLTGQKMISISTKIEIESGEVQCRYFNKISGVYEREWFDLSEVEESEENEKRT